MSYLVPDKVSTVKFSDGYSLTIKQKIIPDTATAPKYVAEWCKKGQRMKPCRPLSGNGRAKVIIVHNSDEIKVSSQTTMSEQYSRATWPNANMSGVVVHYYADAKECWQNLDETEQGWHAADGSTKQHSAHSGASYKYFNGNTDGLAVEIIGANAEENGARLVAWLMIKHGLNINDIYTHNYCMYDADKVFNGVRKNCPIYILDHWQRFLDRVTMYAEVIGLAGTDKPVTPTPAKPAKPAGTTLYRVQVGAFTVYDNAKAYLDKVKADGYKDAFLTTGIYNNKDIYRIQVGAFSSKQNAEAYARKAKRDGYSTFLVTLNK